MLRRSFGSLWSWTAGRRPVDGHGAAVGHSLLLASHSLRSISLGSTTSSLRSKSTTRIFVYSCSKYCFFSSVGGFFPFGFVLDFLQDKKRGEIDHFKRCRHCQTQTGRKVKEPSCDLSPAPCVCLHCVLAQGCHITPVLHFQGFKPPNPPTRPDRCLHRSPGSKVKGRTELQLSGCFVSTVWTNINCRLAANQLAALCLCPPGQMTPGCLYCLQLQVALFGFAEETQGL